MDLTIKRSFKTEEMGLKKTPNFTELRREWEKVAGTTQTLGYLLKTSLRETERRQAIL